MLCLNKVQNKYLTRFRSEQKSFCSRLSGMENNDRPQPGHKASDANPRACPVFGGLRLRTYQEIVQAQGLRDSS